MPSKNAMRMATHVTIEKTLLEATPPQRMVVLLKVLLGFACVHEGMSEGGGEVEDLSLELLGAIVEMAKDHDLGEDELTWAAFDGCSRALSEALKSKVEQLEEKL